MQTCRKIRQVCIFKRDVDTAQKFRDRLLSKTNNRDEKDVKKFADHKTISEQLEIDFYFAHAYHS